MCDLCVCVTVRVCDLLLFPQSIISHAWCVRTNVWGWPVKTRLSSRSTLLFLDICCMEVRLVLRSLDHALIWVWKLNQKCLVTKIFIVSKINTKHCNISCNICVECEPTDNKIKCIPECLSTSALRKVSRRCQGRANCTVLADTLTFGDPCFPGTRKHLRVSFTCGAWWTGCLLLMVRCVVKAEKQFSYFVFSAPVSFGRCGSRVSGSLPDLRLHTWWG